LLLAAEVLVLSRHLHKKVSTDQSSAALVETLRLRLGKLRKKLLTAIDKRLGDFQTGPNEILDAMAAFSLATNSSCGDILRHFHYIRASAISHGLQKDNAERADALHCLQLWIRTMQDTQSLFPRQVSNTLEKLKTKPLLQNEAVSGIHEFDLDVHGLWIGEDINNFTPYVRHDDLTISTAKQLLSTWSPSALRAYVAGLSHFLDSMEDFQAVLDLRQECLHLWFSSSGRTFGITKSESLDILREAFQKRLGALLKNQHKAMEGITGAISSTLLNWPNLRDQSKAPELWKNDLTSLELSHGARLLTSRIHDSVHGTTPLIDSVLAIYQSWLLKINSIKESITGLKAKKWPMEDIDDDEEDDLDEIEDMRHRLEKEDPEQLDRQFQTCLTQSIDTIRNGVRDEQQKLGTDQESGERSAFLLRVLREIKQSLPNGIASKDVEFSYITSLHRTAATPVVEKVISQHSNAISEALLGIKVPVRLLWDGTPEMPIVPSPWPFRFLRSLHEELTATGTDIWTVNAVETLQEVTRYSLAKHLINCGQNSVEYQTNGSPSPEPAVNGDGQVKPAGQDSTSHYTASREAKIQALFDIQYLKAAFRSDQNAANDPLHDFCVEMIKTLNLPGHETERIGKASKEYWKRTSLLFALLA
jgi:conserved oligomeric Golgi complex subunit 1